MRCLVTSSIIIMLVVNSYQWVQSVSVFVCVFVWSVNLFFHDRRSFTSYWMAFLTIRKWIEWVRPNSSERDRFIWNCHEGHSTGFHIPTKVFCLFFAMNESVQFGNTNWMVSRSIRLQIKHSLFYQQVNHPFNHIWNELVLIDFKSSTAWWISE